MPVRTGVAKNQTSGLRAVAAAPAKRPKKVPRSKPTQMGFGRRRSKSSRTVMVA